MKRQIAAELPSSMRPWGREDEGENEYKFLYGNMLIILNTNPVIVPHSCPSTTKSEGREKYHSTHTRDRDILVSQK